jgi:hypothetical protein
MTTKPKAPTEAAQHLLPPGVLQDEPALGKHFLSIGATLHPLVQQLVLTPAAPSVAGRGMLTFSRGWQISADPPEADWTAPASGSAENATGEGPPFEITLEGLTPESGYGIAFTLAADPKTLRAGTQIPYPDDITPPPQYSGLPIEKPIYPGVLIKLEAGAAPPLPSIMFMGELVAGGSIFPLPDTEKKVLLTSVQIHETEFLSLTVVPILLNALHFFSFSAYPVTIK